MSSLSSSRRFHKNLSAAPYRADIWGRLFGTLSHNLFSVVRIVERDNMHYHLNALNGRRRQLLRTS
jgi:hypothetical protein